MLFLVFYIPIRNELLFQRGSFWWETLLLFFIVYGLLFVLFSANESVVRHAFEKVKKEGILRQKKTTKTELWGWSIFFYLPLILSLLFKVPTFVAELTKPFDQKSHDAFEKALSELERPNPLQVLATGYLNNGKHEKPKPKGYEKNIGIDFQEEIDAFNEKEEALKNRGYDQYMQKGVKRQFVDNNDGTITDKSLGLMWQDTAEVGSKTYRVNEIEWVCKRGRTIGGYDDWEVPTAYDLKSLMNFNEDKITDNVFKYGYDAKYDGFWSSTNKNGREDVRLVFYFDSTPPSYSALGAETTRERKELIRCVRRLNIMSPFVKTKSKFFFIPTT